MYERKKILIIEDDILIREVLDLFLTSHGYLIVHANNGLEGIIQFTKESPNLILLDLMLPNLNGIQTCQEIRKVSSVPIIFMSCKSDSKDIIDCLESGADDYVIKPFQMDELLARIRSHLRRFDKVNQPLIANYEEYWYIFKDLKIEEKSQRVYLHEKEIPMSAKEFKILLYLIQRPNQIVQAAELYRNVWKNDSIGDTRTVSVHISKLRKKIEKNPSNPQYIKTIWGGGLMFIEDQVND